MDSLTHLVAGALTPLAFRASPKRAGLVAFGIAVGELPDIDVFFGRSIEALLVLHRGITHALFWQPVFVLIAVIPFFIWLHSSRPRAALAATEAAHNPGCPPDLGNHAPFALSFGKMYLMALFATCTHIYLDCMTTFGTQALLPFSNMRIGLPAMFIVDLLLTVPALILLVLALRTPGKEEAVEQEGKKTGTRLVVGDAARRYARIGLAWLLIYPLISLGINYSATAMLAPALTDQTHDGRGKLLLITEPFTPLVWKAIVDEGEEYRMGSINLINPDPALVEARYTKYDPQLFAQLKQQNEVFAFFEDFSPLMVQQERKATDWGTGEHTQQIKEYSFVDLRYIMAPGSAARMVGRKDPNFVLEARVKDNTRLIAFRFLHRGKDAGHTPWQKVQ